MKLKSKKQKKLKCNKDMNEIKVIAMKGNQRNQLVINF